MFTYEKEYSSHCIKHVFTGSVCRFLHMMTWDTKNPTLKGMCMLKWNFFYWNKVERGRMSGHTGNVITIKQTRGEMTERQGTYLTLTHTLNHMISAMTSNRTYPTLSG